ncbi:MAG: hypothetical protein K5858_01790 [Lachnospiraceae bacterium]|jgi:hypothetical protein|nr:hypothetical protein [Lachnospiraceae bacterium]
MDKPLLTSICENDDGTVKMAIGPNGTVWMAKAPEFKWFDRNFNIEYRYYFKACEFNAAAWCGKKFVVAGMEPGEIDEEDKRCVVYSSENGSVFKQETLSAAMTEGVFVPTKQINSISYDRESDQIFLSGNGGQIIVLTKSPLCTKVKYLANLDIIRTMVCDGGPLGKTFEIEYSNHSITLMGLNDILQPRIDAEEVTKYLNEGAPFIYVVEEGKTEDAQVNLDSKMRYKKDTIEVKREDLTGFLKTYKQSTVMIFVQDRFASYARNCGFKKAYSVSL